MTHTIVDDCDGDVSAADAERPKFGRVSLHAEGGRGFGCESRGRHERDGQAQSGLMEICRCFCAGFPLLVTSFPQQ